MIWKRLRKWLRRWLRRRRRARAGGASRSRRRGGARTRRRERAPSALGTFGARIGRHAGLYGSGQGASLFLGLVTLAVLTRFLPPAEFGRYALYYVLAAVLTLLYTTGWVRGSLRWVFGAGGDDDDDDEEDREDDDRPDLETASGKDKRRALGTALALVAMVATLGTVGVALLAPALAETLTGDRGQARLAILAGAAGAAGAVWTLAATVPRRERRPNTFVALYLSRPVLVLAVTVPLVAIEPEVENAVVGLALGSAAAALAALAGVRNSFALAFGWEDARNIVRLGIRYVPLTVSLWVIANGGVFLLGQYATASDVGYFRVATGVAALASLPVSAFLMAWGPLRREPIHGAVEAERGKLAAGGLLATYFALGAIGILLGLGLGADLLVRVAPPSYAEAAPLIPIIGLGLLLHGWFRVLRRSAKFPHRWEWYVGLAVLAGVVFVAAGVALVSPLGTHGAALAVVAAFLAAAVGMSIRSQRGSDPLPLGYDRMLRGLAIAVGCFAGAQLVGGVAGPLEPAVDVAAFLAYAPLLVATGTVPRAHLAPLRRMAAAAVPGPPRRLNGKVELDRLDEVERAVLEVLVRHRRPMRDVAPLIGASEQEVASTFVAALRRLGGVGGPSEADDGIAAYLLSSAPVAARDQLWRRLSAQGADALEVDALSLTLARLRRVPATSWRGE